MAYQGHVGIPDPTSLPSALSSLGAAGFSFDPLGTAPSLPSPWTSSQTGFYYVENGASGSGNGWPAAPIGLSQLTALTFSAGDVIVFSDAGGNFGALSDTINGGSGDPVWLVAATGDTPTFSGATSVSGGLWVMDGLTFTHNNDPTVAFGGSDEWVLRNCTVHNTDTGVDAGTIISVGGANKVFLYNLDVDGVTPNANWPLTNEDVHGLKISVGTTNIWVIDCHFHHCQGDGIQVANDGDGPANTRFIWIGGGEYDHNYQTGIWFKESSDAVVSSPYVHSNYNSGGSVAAGGGGQYRIQWITWINCLFDDNGGGLQFQSGGTPSDTDNIRAIGCVFMDSTGEGWTSGNSSSTSGFTYRNDNASDVWLVNCTFHTYTDCVHSTKAAPKLYGNYFGTPTQDYHVLTDATLTGDYNFYDATKTTSGSVSPDANSIQSGTPGFVDEAGDDFTPDTGSALLDAMPNSTPYNDVYTDLQTRYGFSDLTTDRNGNDRLGSSLAIGALGAASGGGGGGTLTVGSLTCSTLTVG